MKLDSEYARIQELLVETEAELQSIDDKLCFLVTPQGDLQVVRRNTEHEAPTLVTPLHGCDPLLWQASRPEGPIILGPPYEDPEPHCAFSDRPLPAGPPVDLYYLGQPISPEEALKFSPLLVVVRGIVGAVYSLLAELRDAEEQLEDAENAELRDFLAQRLVREIADRMVVGIGGQPPSPSGEAELSPAEN